MADEKLEKTILNAFAHYNKRANGQMNEIIKTISEEEWDKEFSSFWKSIHQLCLHIFNSDYGWLNRFKLFMNPKNELFSKDNGWGEPSHYPTFKNIDEYIKMRKELDDIIIDFINEITIEDLEKNMRIVDYEGKIVKHKFSIWIIHIFNHATHHRAQVSVYLDMLGKENDFSDFPDRESTVE
jgi:uncharacterized damage-inducible protein DinB